MKIDPVEGNLKETCEYPYHVTNWHVSGVKKLDILSMRAQFMSLILEMLLVNNTGTIQEHHATEVVYCYNTLYISSVYWLLYPSRLIGCLLLNWHLPGSILDPGGHAFNIGSDCSFAECPALEVKVIDLLDINLAPSRFNSWSWGRRI